MENVLKMIHENLAKFAGDDVERELRFHMHNMNGLTYEVYDNLVKTIKRSTKWNDVKFTQDISKTGKAKNSKLPDVRHVSDGTVNTFIIKRKIFVQDYEDYSLRLSAASEIPLEMNVVDFNNNYIVTNIRERSRYSFTSKDGLWKLELSRVKSNDKITFECELECLVKDAPLAKIKSIVALLLKLIHSKHLKTKTEINELLGEYQTLTKTKLPRFAGPLPFTLMKENIERNSFACGYDVTDKADGERKLCYISKSGDVLFLSRSNGFTPDYIGKVSSSYGNTVLDCELLKNNLYIFDCLFYKGSDVRNKNHIKRMQFASKVTKMKKELKMGVKCKTFYFVHKNSVRKMVDGNIVNTKFKTIFEAAHSIWTSKRDYPLDGIIFTPIYEPYFNNKIYKWKDENTIDFFINKLEIGATTEKWGLKLAGFDYRKNYKHFPLGGLDKKGKFLHFTDRPIEIQSLIPVNKGVITLPKSVAKKYDNHSIAEFKYKNNSFYPIGARLDKSVANNVRSANDAWNSITNVITIGDIKDYYYNCARKFHNHIKEILIKKYASKKKVLDFGIGAGGNIKKYENAKVSKLTGINIVNVKYKPRTLPENFHKANKNLYNIQNFTKNKYETVNLMFSVHYFFKDKPTLLNFMNNVLKSTSVGSNVVMTLMNGKKILSKVKNNVFENNVCKIEIKKYDSSKLVGNSMEVKLHGTKYFEESISKEYLVDISEFIKLMKNVGFELKENKSFKSLCTGDLCNSMTKDEKEFSFLNNYLVFKRKNLKLKNTNFNNMLYSWNK